MRSVAACAALIAALVCPGGWPADDWRLERSRDGIEMYTRQVDGWSIREVRGQMRVKARLSSIVAVLDDVEAGRELVEMISTSSVYDRASSTRYRIYSTMDMPFPLTDRDILNQHEVSQDARTLAVTITDVAIKDVLPPKKGFVRIERSHQQWLLKPAPDGSVEVELRQLSDPAGPIPASLINAMAIDTPFKMMSKLRSMVERPKYAQARLSYINEERRQ